MPNAQTTKRAIQKDDRASGTIQLVLLRNPCHLEQFDIPEYRFLDLPNIKPEIEICRSLYLLCYH